jgi:hypothetical protein
MQLILHNCSVQGNNAGDIGGALAFGLASRGLIRQASDYAWLSKLALQHVHNGKPVNMQLVVHSI